MDRCHSLRTPTLKLVVHVFLSRLNHISVSCFAMIFLWFLVLLACWKPASSTITFDPLSRSVRPQQSPLPPADAPTRQYWPPNDVADSDPNRRSKAVTRVGREAAWFGAATSEQQEEAAIAASRRQDENEKVALDAHKQALRGKYAPAAEAETRRREEAARRQAWLAARRHNKDVVRLVHEEDARREKLNAAKARGEHYEPDGPLGKGRQSWRDFKAADMAAQKLARKVVKNGFVRDMRAHRRAWENGESRSPPFARRGNGATASGADSRGVGTRSKNRAGARPGIHLRDDREEDAPPGGAAVAGEQPGVHT